MSEANNNNTVSSILTAARLYEAALGEQTHVKLRRDTLVNIMLSNLGLICSNLIENEELKKKLKDAEELIEVLQNSLGEADDQIKALKQDASPKKKAPNR